MNLDLANKYDRIAERFSEESYANLAFYMERRFMLATTWGKPLSPGNSVLELGCGDGYLAQLFVQGGLRYSGIDMSAGMVATAKRRISEAGLKANFTVADISSLAVSEPYDAVIAYMRAFFTYVPDPLCVLQQLRPHIRKKIIVDLDPRQTPLRVAVDTLEKAGFAKICWRPFFVPEKKQLSSTVLKTLVVCEKIPFFRRAPLRWKFHVILKADIG
jgi:SAM-dependent methyltransferase